MSFHYTKGIQVPMASLEEMVVDLQVFEDFFNKTRKVNNVPVVVKSHNAGVFVVPKWQLPR